MDSSVTSALFKLLMRKSYTLLNGQSYSELQFSWEVMNCCAWRQLHRNNDYHRVWYDHNATAANIYYSMRKFPASSVLATFSNEGLSQEMPSRCFKHQRNESFDIHKTSNGSVHLSFANNSSLSSQDVFWRDTCPYFDDGILGKIPTRVTKTFISYRGPSQYIT